MVLAAEVTRLYSKQKQNAGNRNDLGGYGRTGASGVRLALNTPGLIIHDTNEIEPILFKNGRRGRIWTVRWRQDSRHSSGSHIAWAFVERHPATFFESRHGHGIGSDAGAGFVSGRDQGRGA